MKTFWSNPQPDDKDVLSLIVIGCLMGLAWLVILMGLAP